MNIGDGVRVGVGGRYGMMPISQIVVEIRFDGSVNSSVKPRSGPLGLISLSSRSLPETASLGEKTAPKGSRARIR